MLPSKVASLKCTLITLRRPPQKWLRQKPNGLILQVQLSISSQHQTGFTGRQASILSVGFTSGFYKSRQKTSRLHTPVASSSSKGLTRLSRKACARGGPWLTHFTGSKALRGLEIPRRFLNSILVYHATQGKMDPKRKSRMV